MQVKSRRLIVHIHRIFFKIFSLAGFAVAITTVMAFTSTYKVIEIAIFFLPTLAAFFGFSALLYNRARAYPDGPTQRRCLYAANQAFVATSLYLLALILGAIISFAIFTTGSPRIPKEFKINDGSILPGLLAYWLPLLLIGLSYMSFADSMRISSINIFLFKRTRAQLKLMKKS